VAAAILLLAYLQAATGLIPLKHDPLARLLGMGMRETADRLAELQQQSGARAVLTSDYETTAWLRFYKPALPVVAVDQPNRYLDAPSARFESGSLLYFADRARNPDPAAIGNFDKVKQLADIPRGQGAATYKVWQLDGPQAVIQGKTP
jgi:hypothetical protein